MPAPTRCYPAPVAAPRRPIRWYDLLTRDHTVCKVCFAAGSHEVRLVTDAETILARSTKGRKHVWVLRMRAALRRHIAEVHPGWVASVRWVKD